MIRDRRQIEIHETPEKVFAFIETMPEKFPTFKMLEARPFLFIRALLVSGLRTAMNVVADKPDSSANKAKENNIKVRVLKPGDKMGSFTLAEVERPLIYWFTLKSFSFDCETGYILTLNQGSTVLNFDLIAKNPAFAEKVWWFFVKPLHKILANRVIKNIKKGVEDAALQQCFCSER